MTMKILMAEDDPTVRTLLNALLRKWGYQTTVAEDGLQALEFFGRDTFDVVISDWMMPGLDGLELTRRIRASTTGNYVYVILLTAQSGSANYVTGLDAGADDYMIKPFNAAELESRLRAAERISRLEARLNARNRQLEEVNESMRRGLDAAAKMQRNLLPRSLPDCGLKFASHYRPCEHLAGDIFNLVRLDERHVGFYVLDVSGHGVPSALLSVTLHQVLRPDMTQSFLLKRAIEEPPGYALSTPAQVVQQLNRQFPFSDTDSLYFTIFYGMIDTASGRVRYAQAGAPSPILIRSNGEIVAVEGRGLPIGFFPEADYEEYELTLGPGDRLVVCSDGVFEQPNPDGVEIGSVRVAERLSANAAAPIDDLPGVILAQLDGWAAGADYRDDMTLLAMELAPVTGVG